MTLWQDQDAPDTAPVARMVDAVFTIECRQLPVDHAFDLTRSLISAAPLIKQSNSAGVHPIHLAGSQNGWERPGSDDDGALMLSRRTRLKIRVEKSAADNLIDALSGTTHDIEGHRLTVLSGKTRTIAASATLFARYAVFDISTSPNGGESAFTDAVIDACNALAYQPTKLLCGRSCRIRSPHGIITTRSVLLADVPAEASLVLQDAGIGALRAMGCGLLIPHKDTAAVNPS